MRPAHVRFCERWGGRPPHLLDCELREQGRVAAGSAVATDVRRVRDCVRPCEPAVGSHAVPASASIGRVSSGLLGRRHTPDA